MQTAELITTLSAAGLERIAPAVARISRPSIRLTSSPPTTPESLSIGSSHLGGTPDLPPGTPWPEWQSAPMSFVAQIRLDDAHPFDVEHALPATGLLSFFYDAQQATYGDKPQDHGAWRVLFDDGDPQRLVRLSFPTALPAASRFAACALTCSADLTLPQQPTLEDPSFAFTGDEQQRYETFLSTYPSPSDHSSSHNRLLGHPDTIQDDMRVECQLASHGLSDPSDPKAATLIPTANAWRLLFQLDSDPHAGMQWASSGMLYYWIESTALQQQHFDDTWLILQSE